MVRVSTFFVVLKQARLPGMVILRFRRGMAWLWKSRTATGTMALSDGMGFLIFYQILTKLAMDQYLLIPFLGG